MVGIQSYAIIIIVINRGKNNDNEKAKVIIIKYGFNICLPLEG